jgi:cbb3-type cytochrome oxidase subunit 3
MTATEFSLLAVTISFTGMVLWVYWPSRRAQMESYGSIPLDEEHGHVGGSGHGEEKRA